MFKQFKLSTKMMLLGLGGIVCFAVVLGWVYFKIEGRVYNTKRAALRDVTEVAFSLMTEYEGRIQSGELTPDEARRRVALRVKNLRYSGQEYFWINDTEPKMVMHPFKPELDGKNLNDSKDPDGKYLFVEMVNVCKGKGEGFVDYMWPKPGQDKPVPKMSYVKMFQPWGWIIGSGVYIDDVQKELSELRHIFLGVLLLMGSAGLLFSWWLARSTALPINRAIEGLTANAGQVAAASDQISSASEHLAEGASQQAAAIEETSSSLEEISSMTKQNAENAKQADQFMRETNEILKRASETMRNLTSSMEDISRASEETQKINRTIDEIAFQTNLLALNAAVEAARAGEAGAGFAVVADEVRNLAMRASDSAKNTSSLIDGTVKKIRDGVEMVQKTNNEFSQLGAMVTKSGELVGEIAEASKEQALGVEQLNQAVQEMDTVVQGNAASAEETASVAQELKLQTLKIEALIADLAMMVGATEQSAGDQVRITGDRQSLGKHPSRRMTIKPCKVSEIKRNVRYLPKGN